MLDHWDHILEGTGEGDVLFGGIEDAAFFGADGSDYLIGGEGSEYFFGEEGSDRIWGGGGSDTGIFRLADEIMDFFDYYNGGAGHDTMILDLREAELPEGISNHAQWSQLLESFINQTPSLKNFRVMGLGRLDLVTDQWEDYEILYNTEPVAEDDVWVVDEDSSEVMNVLENDFDLEGDTLTVTLLSQPFYGTLNDLGEGQFEYTPEENYNGFDGFSYEVRDGNGGIDTASVHITVSPLNDAPLEIQLSSDSVMEEVEGAIIGSLETTDVDVGDFHVYSVNDSRFEVMDGTLKLKDGVSLDFETEASVQIQITSMDSVGASVERSFEISVIDDPLDSADLDLDPNIQETLLFEHSDSLLQFGQTITYGFAIPNYSLNGEKNVRIPNTPIQENVRAIFDYMETFLDLSFVEETDPSVISINVLESSTPKYAYAYSPSPSLGNGAGNLGLDIFLNSSFAEQANTNNFGFDPGSHGYEALIHEIGHTLGLMHPHDFTVLDPLLDNQSNTVMSYGHLQPGSGINHSASFRAFDITVLQNIYGAQLYNDTDTLYEFVNPYNYTTNDEDLFISNEWRAFSSTIWDSGGEDTLDFSSLAVESLGYSFDLNPGGELTAVKNFRTLASSGVYDSYSSKGIIAGTTLAYNMLIENIITTTSNDLIYLNVSKNEVGGYDHFGFGQDTIYYGQGNDALLLTSHLSSEVSMDFSGDDLILDFGGGDSITLVEYSLFDDPIDLVFGDATIKSVIVT